MQDDFIASLAAANFDAFVSDLRSGRAQDELAKNLRDTRAAQDVDHEINSFFEDLELRAAGGRAGPAPRLRTEHQESEPEWRPGDAPELGLEKTSELHKRHDGRERVRIEKSGTGWVKEYDSTTGELVRAYAPQVDPEIAFAR